MTLTDLLPVTDVTACCEPLTRESITAENAAAGRVVESTR